MRKNFSGNESHEEDKTGSEDDKEDKKVREDLLDEVTFEQSHE